jgi:hypothetical protein
LVPHDANVFFVEKRNELRKNASTPNLNRGHFCRNTGASVLCGQACVSGEASEGNPLDKRRIWYAISEHPAAADRTGLAVAGTVVGGRMGRLLDGDTGTGRSCQGNASPDRLEGGA